MAQELVFADLLGRTHIGLDFFDATISRIEKRLEELRRLGQCLRVDVE